MVTIIILMGHQGYLHGKCKDKAHMSIRLLKNDVYKTWLLYMTFFENVENVLCSRTFKNVVSICKYILGSIKNLQRQGQIFNVFLFLLIF